MIFQYVLLLELLLKIVAVNTNGEADVLKFTLKNLVPDLSMRSENSETLTLMNSKKQYVINGNSGRTYRVVIETKESNVPQNSNSQFVMAYPSNSFNLEKGSELNLENRSNNEVSSLSALKTVKNRSEIITSTKFNIRYTPSNHLITKSLGNNSRTVESINSSETENGFSLLKQNSSTVIENSFKGSESLLGPASVRQHNLETRKFNQTDIPQNYSSEEEKKKIESVLIPNKLLSEDKFVQNQSSFLEENVKIGSSINNSRKYNRTQLPTKHSSTSLLQEIIPFNKSESNEPNVQLEKENTPVNISTTYYNENETSFDLDFKKKMLNDSAPFNLDPHIESNQTILTWCNSFLQLKPDNYSQLSTKVKQNETEMEDETDIPENFKRLCEKVNGTDDFIDIRISGDEDPFNSSGIDGRAISILTGLGVEQNDEDSSR